MSDAAWVALGGFFGAAARFLIARRMSERWPSDWPTGTLLVNLTGSFLLGWIASLHMETVSLLLGTGFMGAYTTFSTFKMEGVRLWSEGKFRILALYYAVSYTLGIGLAFAGYGLGVWFG